jgi:LPS-assembly lipoprotein
MLSFELTRLVLCRIAAGLALSSLLAAAGCQVRPLYATGPSGAGVSVLSQSISFNEVTSRHAQEVRNHLIFLLNGGAGEPAGAAYKVELGVTKRLTTVAVITPRTGESRPTAGAVVLGSNYVISDAVTGSQIATGAREVTASYDSPRQQFAQLRAQRDAEDRAARELAEALKLAIAADLANK